MQKPKCSILLIDIGSPYNIGNILRTSYDLCADKCTMYVFDPRKIMKELKDKIEKISLNRGKFILVNNLIEFLQKYTGRIILSDIKNNACPLKSFKFLNNDLILFGNENRGYYDSINGKMKIRPELKKYKTSLIVEMLGATKKLPNKNKICSPNHGVYPNCNVSNVAAIVMREVMLQFGYYENFKLK